jgi:hypothetical protein
LKETVGKCTDIIRGVHGAGGVVTHDGGGVGLSGIVIEIDSSGAGALVFKEK